MKTPKFWKTKSRIARALWPLSVLYEMGYVLRRAFTVQVKLPVPVVCIGNITAGGSGKTPLALHIGKMLKEKGVKAFYVSRGYGGENTKIMMVNPNKHRSVEVGDEPLLLAEVLPTVVGPNRVLAAQYAVAKGAKLLIFDDGFQNKKFYKDFSFLVIDGAVGFGNGYLLPAGPLRERFDLAVKRAHSLVMVNPSPSSPAMPEDKPVLYARNKVVGLAERLRGQRVVAFCGIAFPEKFQATLSSIGANVIHFKAYGDHAHYKHATLLPLAEIASKEKAYLVTTRKDWVRLPHGFKDKVVIVDIEMVFANPDMLEAQVDYIAGLA